MTSAAQKIKTLTSSLVSWTKYYPIGPLDPNIYNERFPKSSTWRVLFAKTEYLKYIQVIIEITNGHFRIGCPQSVWNVRIRGGEVRCRWQPMQVLTATTDGPTSVVVVKCSQHLFPLSCSNNIWLLKKPLAFPIQVHRKRTIDLVGVKVPLTELSSPRLPLVLSHNGNHFLVHGWPGSSTYIHHPYFFKKSSFTSRLQ